jgi:hypothetical protein
MVLDAGIGPGSGLGRDPAAVGVGVAVLLEPLVGSGSQSSSVMKFSSLELMREDFEEDGSPFFGWLFNDPDPNKLDMVVISSSLPLPT